MQCARCRATRSNAKKKIFFRKIEKQKRRNRKIEKRPNAKSKNQNFSGNFKVGKRIAEAKRPQSFEAALNLPRSPAERLTAVSGSCGTLDVPRYIPR
jgi:hypothetical protein